MWQSRTRHRARRSTRDPLFRGFVWGCGSTPCPGQDAEEYGPLAASASSNFCPGVVERFAAFGDEFAGLIGQLCGDGERDRMRHDDVTFSHSSRSTYTAGMIGRAVSSWLKRRCWTRLLGWMCGVVTRGLRQVLQRGSGTTAQLVEVETEYWNQFRRRCPY